jgi:phage recombination protein Bet
MTTSVTKHEQLDDGQLLLLKNTIAKGASTAEFDMFVQVCNRLRLDPFSRQIFLVKRYDSSLRAEVAQPQVSIDGFRLVAERTGQYRGQTPPQWCGRDGVWHDVWLADEPPTAARCGVYREGFAEPLYRVARYASYVQTTRDKQTGQMRPNRMWSTMPDVMLHKCTEMLAIRAAFPNELSGVYGTDEMGQANNEDARASLPRVRATLDDVAAPEPRALPAPKGLTRAEMSEATREARAMRGPDYVAAPEPKTLTQSQLSGSPGYREAVAVREPDCLDGTTDEAKFDEYGLQIPNHPCPVVTGKGPHSGKRWDELPGPLVNKMYADNSGKMTMEKVEWCEYLISNRAARKAQESGK